MKQTLIILGICILVAGMPAITAVSLPKFNAYNRSISILDRYTTSEDDIPSWADGTINGTWGLREFFLFNMVEIPIGNISGYYGKLLGPISIFNGQIYPFWNSSDTTNITGIFLGPILFGGIGDINITITSYEIDVNETNYVGIGYQEDDEFDWRIMGASGPTFYLKGDFKEFE